MADLFPDKTYSISELNAIVRGLLETRMGEIRIRGEISNFSRPQSGHMYFTLKDQRAQIRCAMFKNRSFGLRFKPASGMQVVATGRVGLYEARGDYQFIVEKLEEDGAGNLQLQFERLKQRLHAEGLFDSQHKRPLPEYPQTLAIITSATGAALQDVLHVLERRYPLLNVYLLPCSVQGDEAEAQILAAFAKLRDLPDIDTVLLTRGGGSMEDLWVFNSELIAQAIFDCEVPVVTGIGHEIDFTIADFVADYRAPTPSAAAEVITPEKQKLLAILEGFQNLMSFRMQQTLEHKAQSLDWLTPRLQQLHPTQALSETLLRLQSHKERLQSLMKAEVSSAQQRLDHASVRLAQQDPSPELERQRLSFSRLRERLEQSIERDLQRQRTTLETLARTLAAMGPEGTLSRGYAIVQKAGETGKGEIVRDAGQVAVDEPLHITLHQGSLDVKVTHKGKG